jgi:hypothetical protein
MLASVVVTREHLDEFFARDNRHYGHDYRIAQAFHLILFK